ncbi:hypothetical protein B0T25DRAFT_577754 [Lasiosphaeria hispida]|uniref:PARP catalytic domain-containing protein n=1 Tax=Lasiosphaeria hispida TaxID=260671 RepID=A0AAJ0MI51_9PEZI|nr:hypothetical protein B0T25DRAFT_577754 [Lasiosphaeria hispida]
MTSLIAKPLPRSTLYWMWSARDCVKNGAAWEAATVCLLEKKASLIAQSMRLRAAAWAATNELRRKLSPHSALEGRVRATLAGNEIIDDMVKPGVTFHGTALSNVASIIRHGFKMPGKLVDGNLVASPRSGIAYNRGIYSSQAAFYALSYASGQRQLTPLGEVPSMRLFVCATVMGRTLRPDSVRRGSEAGFFGAQKRSSGNDPRIPTEPVLSPGDVKREKEAKKAAAMKWFPYGFGSATGTHLVIQEVGAISDDEEEYGDWQDERHMSAARTGTRM